MSPDLHSIQRNTAKNDVDEKRKRTYTLDSLHMQKERMPQDSNRLANEHEITKELNSNSVALLNLNRAKGSLDKNLIYDEMIKEVVPTSKLKEYQYIPKDDSSSNIIKNSKEGYDQGNTENENATEKPNHSYISLIACAVLASPEKRLVLSDIYNFILENFSYFRNKGPGWRNSIRHNLSLNECFIKAGRSPNGKGHYWAIHPNNYEDFLKGDFRRRRAQRRTKRMIGLPDLDEASHPLWYQPYSLMKDRIRSEIQFTTPPYPIPSAFRCTTLPSQNIYRNTSRFDSTLPRQESKRGFDIDSLLKDDKSESDRCDKSSVTSICYSSCSSCTRESCCRNKLTSYSPISRSYSKACDCRVSPHSTMNCVKDSECWCSSSVRQSLCSNTQTRSAYCKTYRSNELLDFR